MYISTSISVKTPLKYIILKYFVLDAESGGVDVIFITPEMSLTERWIEVFSKKYIVHMLVFDECHCVWIW